MLARSRHLDTYARNQTQLEPKEASQTSTKFHEKILRSSSVTFSETSFLLQTSILTTNLEKFSHKLLSIKLVQWDQR